MKILRFINKIGILFLEEIILPAFAAIIIMGIGYILAYIIGWVAVALGMEPTKEEAIDGIPGLGIMLLMSFFVFCAICRAIWKAITWLSEMWEEF